MNKKKVLHAVREEGLIPLFYHPDFDVARDVLKACAAGGGHLVEFVNRGEKALEIFSRLCDVASAEIPEMILGAGTIFDRKDALAFIEAGASYIVAPCFDAGVAEVCREKEVLYIPGVATPGEIHTALLGGADLCKIFPGECLGPAFVKAVKTVFPETTFLVSGGVMVDEENLSQWFRAGADCVGMGSKLVGKKRVESRDYEGIRRDVQTALEIIRRVRSTDQ